MRIQQRNHGIKEENNNLKGVSQAEKYKANNSPGNRLNSGNNTSRFSNMHIFIFNKARANGATGKHRNITG